jgi:chromosome segregation ATPase
LYCLVLPCIRSAYEQLKLRYESLELRAQQAQQAAAAAAARAEQADALNARLERLQGEHAALRASAEAASGSRDGELASLRATVASLRDELADLRSVNEVLRGQATRAAQQQQLTPTASLADGAGGLLERSLSGASAASSLPPQLSSRQATAASELGSDAPPFSPDAGGLGWQGW